MKLTDKVRKYMERVEKDTGREIVIERASELAIRGMKFSFEPDQENFIIRTTVDFDEIEEKYQESIIHEATHGLLYYVKGYYNPESKSTPTDNEESILSILATMVDDIVVNKTMQDEGFRRNWKEISRGLNKEIKDMRASRDYYEKNSSDPLEKSRLKVLRYVVCWGSLKHLKLRPKAERIVERYLKVSEEHYPDEFRMAKKITEVITQNDIFDPVGHEKAMREILKLWGLEESTELKYYSSK